MDTKEIIFFGAGPIGASVGGWIAEHYPHVYFIDQGPVAEGMRANGITLYEGGKPSTRHTLTVNVINDIAERPNADIIVFAVKNYSLDAVANVVREKVGDKPIVVGLQNGIENQSILPRHFSKALYGVIGYNAWMDEPGVIGYQKKGPIILGTPDNSLQNEIAEVADIFRIGVETVVTNHLADAVHSKIIINLTNSVTTLIGHGVKPVSSIGLLQRILSNVLYEGVRIVKAAGYGECKIGGMPPWLLLTASAKLPQLITQPLFKKNLAKMVLSSMAQDVIQRKGAQTEIDTINGYIVQLAEKTGTPAPYNKAVFAICKERFAAPDFAPMEVEELWREVAARL